MHCKHSDDAPLAAAAELHTTFTLDSADAEDWRNWCGAAPPGGKHAGLYRGGSIFRFEKTLWIDTSCLTILNVDVYPCVQVYTSLWENL